MHLRNTSGVLKLTILIIALFSNLAHAEPSATKKPNILIIWGDDIGEFNLSAYHRGVMGYKTPNIDAIAQQGALFTDW